MRNKTKNKSNPPQTQPQIEQKSQTSSPLSEEAIESFEVELCWCINQLRTALRIGKLNAKQIQDHTKALNTLMSKTAPIIKKRQVMRLSFGDYRKKIAVEDKRVSKVNQHLKLSPRKPSNKSAFIKKASVESTRKEFKFDFDIPKNSDDAKCENVEGLPLIVDKLEDFQFNSSSNNFKFNFDISS